MVSIHLFTDVCLPGPKQGARWASAGQPVCLYRWHTQGKPPLPKLSSKAQDMRIETSFTFPFLPPNERPRARSDGEAGERGLSDIWHGGAIPKSQMCPRKQTGTSETRLGGMDNSWTRKGAPRGLGRSSTPWRGKRRGSLFPEVIESPKMKSALSFAFSLVYGILGFVFVLPYQRFYFYPVMCFILSLSRFRKYSQLAFLILRYSVRSGSRLFFLTG